jgi:hypothetical protein
MKCWKAVRVVLCKRHDPLVEASARLEVQRLRPRRSSAAHAGCSTIPKFRRHPQRTVTGAIAGSRIYSALAHA